MLEVRVLAAAGLPIPAPSKPDIQRLDVFVSVIGKSLYKSIAADGPNIDILMNFSFPVTFWTPQDEVFVKLGFRDKEKKIEKLLGQTNQLLDAVIQESSDEWYHLQNPKTQSAEGTVRIAFVPNLLAVPRSPSVTIIAPTNSSLSSSIGLASLTASAGMRTAETLGSHRAPPSSSSAPVSVPTSSPVANRPLNKESSTQKEETTSPNLNTPDQRFLQHRLQRRESQLIRSVSQSEFDLPKNHKGAPQSENNSRNSDVKASLRGEAIKDEFLFPYMSVDDCKDALIVIVGPKGERFNGTVINRNGELMLYFRPTHVGRYQVSAIRDGADIFEGAYVVEVKRQGLTRQKIELPLATVVGEEGFALELGQLLDRYGRIFDVLASQVTCRITPPGIDYYVAITKGVVRITFMPRVSGFFAVQVMINDEALLVEPLTFTSDLDLGAGMGVGGEISSSEPTFDPTSLPPLPPPPTPIPDPKSVSEPTPPPPPVAEASEAPKKAPSAPVEQTVDAPKPKFRQQQFPTNKVTVYSRGLKFNLQPIIDDKGNPINFKFSDLRVDVQGPQKVEGEIEIGPDGKVLIRVKPTVRGDFTVMVYLFDKPLMVDPISFVVDLDR